MPHIDGARLRAFVEARGVESLESRPDGVGSEAELTSVSAPDAVTNAYRDGLDPVLALLGSRSANATPRDELRIQGGLIAGSVSPFEVVATGGPMTFLFGADAGDAVLYVKAGGSASEWDYTKSTAGAPLEMTARPGERIGLAIHAYTGSQIVLVVRGVESQVTSDPPGE